jgi:hypothetical protein
MQNKRKTVNQKINNKLREWSDYSKEILFVKKKKANNNELKANFYNNKASD